MNTSHTYVATDGDGIGQRVGRSSLSDDLDGLRDVSQRIETGNQMIQDFVRSRTGDLISGGGDELNFTIPTEAVDQLEIVRKDYSFIVGATLSIGLGSKLSEANKALHVAKLRGKDQIVQFDEQVGQEWLAAEQAANDGTATGEAKKIGDAYMKKNEESNFPPKDAKDKKPAPENKPDAKAPTESPTDDHEHSDDNCEYCNEADGVDDSEVSDEHGDCQYCAEAEQNQDDPNDCEYCNEADSAGPDHEHADSDCQYCAEADAQTQENAQAPEANVEDSDGDQVQPQNDPEGQASTPEGMQNILGQLDTDGTEPTDPAEVASQFDDTQVVGDEMEDNTSRPDGFDQNTPGDMGLSEDEQPEEAGPDLTEVLQGGLDNHAQNMQKQKVVQLVSEALEGFKANKQVLEKAKTQAPDFYNASISMLKAMIEMAGMLGFGGDVEQADPATPAPGEEQPAEDSQPGSDGKPQSDWNNPFPQHPGTKGGEKPAPSKPGEKQDPKPVRQ